MLTDCTFPAKSNLMGQKAKRQCEQTENEKGNGTFDSLIRDDNATKKPKRDKIKVAQVRKFIIEKHEKEKGRSGPSWNRRYLSATDVTPIK